MEAIAVQTHIASLPNPVEFSRYHRVEQDQGRHCRRCESNLSSVHSLKLTGFLFIIFWPLAKSIFLLRPVAITVRNFAFVKSFFIASFQLRHRPLFAFLLEIVTKNRS